MSFKKWHKNLYENHDYDDNYTDKTFLKDLKTNKNIKNINFVVATKYATRLNQQISIVIIFLIIFYKMYMNVLCPKIILINSSWIVIIGYMVYRKRNYNLNIIIDDIKTVLSVLIFGYLFSPILHTLTNSISTDKIFSTTFFIMFLHIIFYDYGISSFIVSKTISLNLAIFGTICLASRLSSSFHAFVLLVVSSEIFVLSPILLNEKYILFSSHFVFIVIVIISVYNLYNISLSLLIIYLLLLLFINIICPYIYVTQQKYKNNIHGPWDEAIVNDLDEID